MKLHTLRVYGFERATLADLIAAVNKFTSGQAVTAVETGTVAYGAGEAKNRELVQHAYFVLAGPKYSLVLYYTE